MTTSSMYGLSAARVGPADAGLDRPADRPRPDPGHRRHDRRRAGHRGRDLGRASRNEQRDTAPADRVPGRDRTIRIRSPSPTMISTAQSPAPLHNAGDRQRQPDLPAERDRRPGPGRRDHRGSSVSISPATHCATPASPLEITGMCSAELRFANAAGTVLVVNVLAPPNDFTPFVVSSNHAGSAAVDVVTDVSGWRVEVGRGRRPRALLVGVRAGRDRHGRPAALVARTGRPVGDNGRVTKPAIPNVLAARYASPAMADDLVARQQDRRRTQALARGARRAARAGRAGRRRRDRRLPARRRSRAPTRSTSTRSPPASGSPATT